MSDPITVARPYAKAAFEVALSLGNLSAWREMLSVLSEVFLSEKCEEVHSHQPIPRSVWVEILSSVVFPANQEQLNFIELLVDNGRVTLFPEIAALFEKFFEEASGVLRAKVFSPYPLTDQQCSTLQQLISSRYHAKIELDQVIDAKWIGGCCVQVGDEVIDMSVRNQLAQIASSLKF